MSTSERQPPSRPAGHADAGGPVAVPSGPAPQGARQAEPTPSRFGASLLDSVWLEAGADPGKRRRRQTQAHAPFDLCHVGVVLRTVVFVNGVLAIALLFTHPGAAAWLDAFSVAAGVVLPGVLVWLCLACMAKGVLARSATPLQWVIGSALGALSGGVSWGLGEWTGLDMLGGRPWLGPVLAGGAMAWGVTLWLQWREQARFPAEATARLAELQSRIRPHFLFNTLNTALALVRLDPARAEGVLEDLSELFRVALTENGQAVSLADEIDLARRYLAIEQIRFGGRLKIVWELDAAAGAARVPPLLLQPLVENAVHHGVEHSSAGGQLRIRTRVTAGRVHLSIANTVASGPARPGHGMALRNVKERLRLMHDVAGRFESRLHDGVFRVHITLPL
jgi:two-component system sensor histidine kinase AlgZ